MSGQSKAYQQDREAAALAGLEPTANPKVSWLPGFLPRIRDMAFLGYANDEIAEAIGVDPRTLDRWLVEKPLLKRYVHAAREGADVRVARSLHRRATGYDIKAKRVKRDGSGQVIETIEEIKHVPASDAAATYWLNNRQSRRWKAPNVAGTQVNLSLLQVVEASLADLQKDDARPALLDLVGEPMKSDLDDDATDPSA